MCQQWQMFADPMPCPRYIIPISSCPPPVTHNAQLRRLWLSGFVASLGHVICIRPSPSLRSPWDPSFCSLPSQGLSIPRSHKHSLALPWCVSKTLAGNAVTDTLSSRGVVCVWGGGSMHESLQCLMRRFTLRNQPWHHHLFYLLSGAVLLQSRQGGGDSPLQGDPGAQRAPK